MKNLLLSVCTFALMLLSCNDNGESSNRIVAIEPIKNVQYVSKIELTNKAKDSGYTTENIKFLKNIGAIATSTLTDNIELVDRDKATLYLSRFGVKYLSETYMDNFMKKNNLIMGGIERFKENIPAENLAEFKKNYEHIVSVDPKYGSFYFIREDYENGCKFLQIIDKEEIRIPLSNIRESSFLCEGQDWQAKSSALHPDREAFYRAKYNISKKTDIIVDRHYSDLRVVAPVTHFNTEGMRVEDNQLVAAGTDPAIVLRCYEGGWLVLTAWK